jgi:hypothetical protein
LSLEFGSANTWTCGNATTYRPLALSPETIERSRGPMVASTIVCAVPAGKIMTIVSGLGPCSILRVRDVVVTGVGGDAMGCVDGCGLTRGTGSVGCELSTSTARVSGMLMKST